MGRLASRRCALFIAYDASHIPHRNYRIIPCTPSDTVG